MNVQAQPTPRPAAPFRTMIVDCDIHPVAEAATIKRYLAPEWHDFLDRYAGFAKSPFAGLDPFAGIEPNIARRDSYPPNGLPGTDLPFMQAQHLDANNVEYGMLQPLTPNGGMQRNLEFGAALCRATNDWQLEYWAESEPRLKASITVAQDHVEAAVAEIRRCADNPHFAQIAMLQRATEPPGRKRYWPIYELAQEYDLPIGVHVGGHGGFPPMGAAGWPSYHIQQHQVTHGGFVAFLLSLIMEGVFEAFPRLRLMLVEGAFTWIPSFLWRMDSIWERMRSEAPYLKRPPSEYFREQVWVSSQPMDVYKDTDDLKQLIDWLGWDKLCFASDYPHWDFDDPRYVFPFELSAEQRQAVFSDNAKTVLRV